MVKWEYMSFHSVWDAQRGVYEVNDAQGQTHTFSASAEYLSHLGEDGWELVAIMPAYSVSEQQQSVQTSEVVAREFILKRPKEVRDNKEVGDNGG